MWWSVQPDHLAARHGFRMAHSAKGKRRIVSMRGSKKTKLPMLSCKKHAVRAPGLDDSKFVVGRRFVSERPREDSMNDIVQETEEQRGGGAIGRTTSTVRISSAESKSVAKEPHGA